jgi:hypothetical protein
MRNPADDSLDVSNTGLRRLDEVCEKANLERLNAARNQIAVIPPAVAQLELLEWLNLHDNNISEVPIELTRLELLRQLDLSSPASAIHLDGNLLRSSAPTPITMHDTESSGRAMATIWSETYDS